MHLKICFLLASILQCGLLGFVGASIHSQRREGRILLKVFKTLDAILEDAIVSTGRELGRDIALLKDAIKLNISNANGNNIINGAHAKVVGEETNQILVKPTITMKGIILRRTVNGKLRPTKSIRVWYPNSKAISKSYHGGSKSSKSQFKQEIKQKNKPKSKSFTDSKPSKTLDKTESGSFGSFGGFGEIKPVKSESYGSFGPVVHSKSSGNSGQFGTFTNADSFKHSEVSPIKDSFGTSKSSDDGFGRFADFKPNKPKVEGFGNFGAVKPSKTIGATDTFNLGTFGGFKDIKPSKTLDKTESGSFGSFGGFKDSKPSKTLDKTESGSFGSFGEIKPVKSESYGSFKPIMDQPVQTGSSDTMEEFPRGSKHHQTQEDHSQGSFGSTHVEISEGSFGSKTDKCKGIKRRKCSSDSHCSCFGFYRCVKGRCKTRGRKSKAATTFQSKLDLGTWHEAPKTPMYQTNSETNPVFN